MMKKVTFIVFFIGLILVGCKQPGKKVSPVDELHGKPATLTIKPEEETKRKWAIEIGGKKKEEERGGEPKEKAPSEFVFPMVTEEVKSAVPPPRYEGEKVDMTFNFDNADIKEVIRAWLDEILKVNYVLDKRVGGTITLHTSGAVYKEELFPIIQTILNLHGFAMVKQDKLYEVVPIQDARQLPDVIYKGDKVIKGGSDLITQIIPLSYILPQELIPTLRTFLTQGGTAVAPNDTGVVIVIDSATNMERLITIAKTFDIPFFAGKAIKFYEIKHIDVQNLARHLESIAGSLGANTKGPKADLAFLNFTEANKLLVATKIPEFFKIIDLWIKNLDISPREGEKVRMYVYKMQHILAEQLAPIINEVFKEEIEKLKSAPPSIAKKELKIIADPGTNSLIIKATESDYNRIRGIIEGMDATPQQVLIEVVIAEVKLNENLQYGVSYFIQDRFKIGEDGTADLENPQRKLTANLGAVDPTKGSLVFLNKSIGFDLLFSALAGESTFEFLSTPHILVRDDHTATIQVGEDRPILTSSTQVATGIAPTQNVQYRAVGIILTVTPHIGENGMVTLDITQEDSEVGGTGVLDNPIFTTRKAETSLVIKDGNTVLIGGIIETRKTVSSIKIPLVSNIPILGNLFKSKSNDKSKTELLVLITPRIINTADEAEQLTKEFEKKLRASELLKGHKSGGKAGDKADGSWSG